MPTGTRGVPSENLLIYIKGSVHPDNKICIFNKRNKALNPEGNCEKFCVKGAGLGRKTKMSLPDSASPHNSLNFNWVGFLYPVVFRYIYSGGTIIHLQPLLTNSILKSLLS